MVERGYVFRLERPGRAALLRLNVRLLARRASETLPHDMHTGMHDVPDWDAGRAPEVAIEQPINRQVRKLSTARPTATSGTEPTSWWATAAGIDAKGSVLQVRARPGEGYSEYKDRLLAVERQHREPP